MCLVIKKVQERQRKEKKIRINYEKHEHEQSCSREEYKDYEHVFLKKIIKQKVSVQTNLERNPLNLFYIFLLNVNFEIFKNYIFFMFLTYVSNFIQIRDKLIFFMHNCLPQKLKI